MTATPKQNALYRKAVKDPKVAQSLGITQDDARRMCDEVVIRGPVNSPKAKRK